MKAWTVLVCLGISTAVSADDLSEPEYPMFKTGGSLGLPSGSSSASVTGGGGLNGLALDALAKAGLRISDSFRFFVVGESTQLPVTTTTMDATNGTLDSQLAFTSLAFRIAGGVRPVSPNDKQLCCNALVRGNLVQAERDACERVGVEVDDVTGGECPMFPKPSTVRWGVGMRALAPRSINDAHVDNLGLAAELDVELHFDAGHAFLSAAGFILQSWKEKTSAGDVTFASTKDGRVTLGFQYTRRGLHVGGVGHLGCQQWALDTTNGKTCYFDGGIVIDVRNIPKMNQLNVYLGIQRQAGAEQLKAAGLIEHETDFVLRITPGITF